MVVEMVGHETMVVEENKNFLSEEKQDEESADRKFLFVLKDESSSVSLIYFLLKENKRMSIRRKSQRKRDKVHVQYSLSSIKYPSPSSTTWRNILINCMTPSSFQ